MFDQLIDLLTETENAYFAALKQHQTAHNAESKRALKEALARLDAAKAEADRVLHQSAS
ncbi:MAG: hypothetical protein ABIJ09_08980 [Pseudomonadota bacterium]